MNHNFEKRLPTPFSLQRRVPSAALDAHSCGLLSDVTWHSAVSVAAVLGRDEPAESNINRLLGAARAVFDLYRLRLRLGTPHLSGGRRLNRSRAQIRSRCPRRAFTLLEALMAAGILFAVVVGVTSAVTAGQLHAFEARQRIAASLAAEELIGRIRLVFLGPAQHTPATRFPPDLRLHRHACALCRQPPACPSSRFVAQRSVSLIPSFKLKSRPSLCSELHHPSLATSLAAR